MYDGLLICSGPSKLNDMLLLLEKQAIPQHVVLVNSAIQGVNGIAIQAGRNAYLISRDWPACLADMVNRHPHKNLITCIYLPGDNDNFWMKNITSLHIQTVIPKYETEIELSDGEDGIHISRHPYSMFCGIQMLVALGARNIFGAGVSLCGPGYEEISKCLRWNWDSKYRDMLRDIGVSFQSYALST